MKEGENFHQHYCGLNGVVRFELEEKGKANAKWGKLLLSLV